MTPILKIVPRLSWQQAEVAGTFTGSDVDLADGYIHFSTPDQAIETARRHFAGQDDLLLVAVDPAVLGEALRWEPSRGGALFPHLYGALPTALALWVRPLPLGPGGTHDFAGLLA